MSGYLKNKNLLLLILIGQEAFGAVIPYFFLLSSVSLLLIFLNFMQMDLLWISRSFLKQLQLGLGFFSPLVVSISIAYYAAMRMKIPQMVVGALTMAVYMTIALLEHVGSQKYLLPYFSATVIFAPVASSYFLYILYPYLSLRLPLYDANRHIYKLFNYLFVFLASYVIVIGIYYGLDFLLDWGLDGLGVLMHESLPTSIYLIIRNTFVQFFWFFGIHGEHTVNLFFPYRDFTGDIVSHLSYMEFNRLFVTIGGAGSGLAILIAALFQVRSRTMKIITRISIPFALFNINTLLIFAFVVLNRYLLLPFLIVPLINIGLAYGFIHWAPVHFTTFPVLWNSPVFLDGFLKTQEGWSVVFFQLFLLGLNTLIYYRAMRRFVETQSLPTQLIKLSDELNVQEEMASLSHIGAYQAYSEIINANAELDQVLKNLNQKKMHIYYQPKINMHHNKCNQFEALIRYWNNGRLTGPIFLDTIEKAGMAPVVDLWVCHQVHNDMNRWQEEGFEPEISINLHPDTLRSTEMVKKILSIMGEKRVRFEIIERSFLDQDSAAKNLSLLQQHSISIDDFGYGYSNLETLMNLKIDELKLDRTLIQKIDEPKGQAVCRNITRFCHEIGIEVVAEGVETEEEKKLVVEMGIDTIQGWYYSQAIPFDKIKPYAETFGTVEKKKDKKQPD